MFSTERQSGCLVARLGPQCSSLDDAAVDEARAELLRLADSCDPPFVVFDLVDVEFAGSTFIELLFRAHTRVTRRGGRLALCRVSDHLRDVLHVTRLDTVFAIHDSPQSAATALQEAASFQPSLER